MQISPNRKSNKSKFFDRVFTAISDMCSTCFSYVDNLDSLVSITNQTRFIFATPYKSK